LKHIGSRSNLQHGFSLIELALASAILALAGGVIAGGLIAVNRGADLRVQRMMTASILANQLASLDDQLTGDTPGEGAVSTPVGEFAWAIETVESPLPAVAQVTITTTHQGHTDRTVTYRLRPAEQP
jgi:prepilin-type N-terminal cleavage/methylation domain-containing protein